MKNKKLIFGLMTLSFIMIISGSVATFIIGLKADREETLNRMETVNNEFEVFSTNTSIFESVRDELYNSFLGNIYYETMYQLDSETKNKLSNYENLVDELEKNVKKLDSVCSKNTYYPSPEANSRCKNYKSIYEQVNNYFLTDIKVYNSHIDQFNTYQEEQNSLYRISKYTTKRKYVDYNNDKKYDGKED